MGKSKNISDTSSFSLKPLSLEAGGTPSEDTPSSAQSSGSIFNITGRNYDKEDKRRTINVMTPEVVAAFDKANVSNRDAVFITGLIATALKVDLQTVILNRTSISKARTEIRKRECERMKILIQNTPVSFLIVHWDGKLIPDDVTCKKVDRLPVLVSSDKFTKILNVPALHDQKANSIALAVHASLKDWGLQELTKGLCCDTTNVNLRNRGGAAMLLEQMMGKDLLYLACCRHVFELILRAAFEVKFPGTSGPHVPIFKRFREKWYDFDLESSENGLNGLGNFLESEVPVVMLNIKKYLQEQQPRNDYRELL